MRGRTFVLITAGCALLAAAAMLLYHLDTEQPTYNGRPLSQWIQATSQDPGDRQAHEAIIHITTNSVPVLLRWMFHAVAPRYGLMNKLPTVMFKNPLVRRFLYRENEIARAAWAFRAFELAGTNATSAIPALAAMTTDSNPEPVAMLAIHVLSLLGPAAVPAIRQAMKSIDPGVRFMAIGALRRFGTNATEAIPDIATALLDQDFKVRQNATNTLETLHPGLLTNTPAQ